MIKLFDQEFAVQQTLKAQREEALAESREEGMLKAFFNMVRKGILTVSIAAKETGMKEEDFQTLMNQQNTEEAEHEKGPQL